jgi:hypothetical protein
LEKLANYVFNGYFKESPETHTGDKPEIWETKRTLRLSKRRSGVSTPLVQFLPR